MKFGRVLNSTKNLSLGREVRFRASYFQTLYFVLSSSKSQANVFRAGVGESPKIVANNARRSHARKNFVVVNKKTFVDRLDFYGKAQLANDTRQE